MSYRAIGLMSGTSMDGIDAALIETDGERLIAAGPAVTTPYDPALRARIAAVLGVEERTPAIEALEAEITAAQAEAVEALLAQASLAPEAVDVVGFHGQTITHRPDAGWTWQLGDGMAMAAATKIATVYDFRRADMAAGGQGAPLAPVYHRALAADLTGPVAFLNVGGVANLTFIMEAGAAPIGFDTGPGNAPLDDLVARRTGAAMDADGRIAAAGVVDEAVLARLMDDPYFARPYPKSLDRNGFDLSPVEPLSTENAAATLTAFTAEAVAAAARLLPARPARWLVCGGGRRNPTLMAVLARRLGAPVEPVEAIGADGDALEAQAFAFMAVRRLRDLPITFPETTGARAPTVGGMLAHPVTVR